LQAVATDGGVDILPIEQDVRRAVRAVSKKWWQSFGYNYVLTTIHTTLHEVIALMQFVLLLLDNYDSCATISGIIRGKGNDWGCSCRCYPQRSPQVDVEVTKIASENLTTSGGLEGAENILRETTGSDDLVG
jgi:hypothetical protein